MNVRIALGLSLAFVLGVACAHLVPRDSSKPTAQVAVPILRASLIESPGCNRAEPQQRASASSERSIRNVADPAAQFAASLDGPDGDAKLAKVRDAFTQWLLAAPVEAMNAAARIPIDSREAVVAPGLARLAEQRPTQALSLLGSVTENYSTYASAVLGVIAKTDPRRALEWATQNADRDPRAEMMRAIVPELAAKNLDIAASAVAAMADRAPPSLIRQVATEYAVRDPQQAYTWARSVAQSQAAADDIMTGVSAALAAHNLDGAAVFLSQAVDPRIRASLIREIGNRKSEADLRDAWNWLNQYSADASYSENARNLLYRWAYLRPEEVASLLRTVTDSEVRLAAARELSLQWQRRDSDAYQAWVGSLPPGPLKSAMVSTTQ